MLIFRFSLALFCMNFMASLAASAAAEVLQAQSPAQLARFVAEPFAVKADSSQSVSRLKSDQGPSGGRYGYAQIDRQLAVIDTASQSIIALLPQYARGPMAAHPDGATLYVAVDDGIVVIDTRSRTVAALVPVGYPLELRLSPDGKMLFVIISGSTSHATNPLLAIDTKSMVVTPVLSGPGYDHISKMALTPDGSRLYAALNFRDITQHSRVEVIDTATLGVVASVPISANALVADPAGRSMLATTSDGLALIDVASNTVSAVIDLQSDGGPSPLRLGATILTVDRDGAFAYIGMTSGSFFNGDLGLVQVVDLQARDLVATIDLDMVPTAMIADADSEQLYVSGQMLGTVSRPTLTRPAGVAVINTSSRSVMAAIPPISTGYATVGPGALALNPASGSLCASDGTAMSIINTTSLEVEASLPAARAMLFAPDLPPVPGAGWQYVLASRNGAIIAQPLGVRGDVATTADYDGDGRADFALRRPRNGLETSVWQVTRSSDGDTVRQQWGATALGDMPVSGDFDGDSRADFGVWRTSVGEWFVLRSSDGGLINWRFGINSETPVPADYDGDGATDLAAYGAGNWRIFGTRVGVTSVQLGTGFDLPAPGDYNGDGRADAAVFNPLNGDWQLLESGSTTPRTVTWGAPGDIPVPADYDGDGRTDIAIWRPSTGAWWVISSQNGAYLSATWGAAGDRPTPADFDGDGKADLAVHRS